MIDALRAAFDLTRLATAGAAATLVLWLAFADGGYFPESWWPLTASLVLASGAAVVARDRIVASRNELLLVGVLIAFGTWQLLSGAWSPGIGAAVVESSRTVVYVAVATTVVACVRLRDVGSLVGGLATGAAGVALWGLGESLMTGASDVRLNQPIGYANAVGVLGGATLVIALVSASAALPPWHAVSAVATAPIAAATYLTLSRGAFVAAALAATIALLAGRSRVRRPRLAASLATASTGIGVVVVATSWQAATGLAFACVVSLVAARGPTSWRGSATVVAAGLAITTAAWLAASLQPSPQSSDEASQQQLGRFADLGNNVRLSYWSVALSMAEDEPLHGIGAGGYEARWLAQRDGPIVTHDAHNLYLETLGELGPVGLALLLALAGLPVAAFLRAPPDTIGTAALGGYVTIAAHAFVDWDWELPVVTCVWIALGTALLLRARASAGRVVAVSRVGAIMLLATLLVGSAVVGRAFERVATSREALLENRPADAFAAALGASRAAPWWALPHELAADAARDAGRPDEAARQYRRAIELDSSSWAAWRGLASVTSGVERERAAARARILNPFAP